MTGSEADEIGRRLSIHLRKNNFEACHGVLDSIEKERAKKYSSRSTLAETGLSLRWVNFLEASGYLYVDQLSGLSSRDIDKLCSRIRNLGPIAATAIKVALGKEEELCKL